MFLPVLRDECRADTGIRLFQIFGTVQRPQFHPRTFVVTNTHPHNNPFRVKSYPDYVKMLPQNGRTFDQNYDGLSHFINKLPF